MNFNIKLKNSLLKKTKYKISVEYEEKRTKSSFKKPGKVSFSDPNLPSVVY